MNRPKRTLKPKYKISPLPEKKKKRASARQKNNETEEIPLPEAPSPILPYRTKAKQLHSPKTALAKNSPTDVKVASESKPQKSFEDDTVRSSTSSILLPIPNIKLHKPIAPHSEADSSENDTRKSFDDSLSSASSSLQYIPKKWRHRQKATGDTKTDSSDNDARTSTSSILMNRKRTKTDDLPKSKRPKRNSAQRGRDLQTQKISASESEIEEDPYQDSEYGSDSNFEYSGTASSSSDEECQSFSSTKKVKSTKHNASINEEESDTDDVPPGLQKELDKYLADVPIIDISLKPEPRTLHRAQQYLDTIIEEKSDHHSSGNVTIESQLNVSQKSVDRLQETNKPNIGRKILKQQKHAKENIKPVENCNVGGSFDSDNTKKPFPSKSDTKVSDFTKDADDLVQSITPEKERLQKIERFFPSKSDTKVSDFTKDADDLVQSITPEKEKPQKIERLSILSLKKYIQTSYDPEIIKTEIAKLKKATVNTETYKNVKDNTYTLHQKKMYSSEEEEPALRALIGGSSYNAESFEIFHSVPNLPEDDQTDASSRANSPTISINRIRIFEQLRSLESDSDSISVPSYSTLTANESYSDDQVSETQSITGEEAWTESTRPIPHFDFNFLSEGLRVEVPSDPSELDLFKLVFSDELLDQLVSSTNKSGLHLATANQPHTRHSRKKEFREVDKDEMLVFLGLCLLKGHLRAPKTRSAFSSDPLYYHPIFPYVMSGRRFEQILRNFTVSDSTVSGANKIVPFLEALTENFRRIFGPSKELSIDESLLLFRGRLHFRQYMKSKKARYGIKFYELTSADGYVLSVMMYAGKEDDSDTLSKKTEQIVMKLLKPYLYKGHHVFMDNYYNDVELSQKLLSVRTHTCGTLRRNRKTNPKVLTSAKLKKGGYIWRRKGKVYVSAWKDKRPVFLITTRNHPEMKLDPNRYGKMQNKPAEVIDYNKFMGGIDRKDQMISYYSSPRKSIRWHKKVIFHLLDIAVWNAYYLYKLYFRKSSFLEFRDRLIKQMMNIDPKLQGKDVVRSASIHSSRRTDNIAIQAPVEQSPAMMQGHWPEPIPCPTISNRVKYLNCAMCTKNKKRKETKFRCKGCIKKTPLCPGCFETWHATIFT